MHGTHLSHMRKTCVIRIWNIMCSHACDTCVGNHICDTWVSRMYHMRDFAHMCHIRGIFTLVSTDLRALIPFRKFYHDRMCSPSKYHMSTPKLQKIIPWIKLDKKNYSF